MSWTAGVLIELAVTPYSNPETHIPTVRTGVCKSHRALELSVFACGFRSFPMKRIASHDNQDIRSMARLPRIVIPGIAHHVTQRGNHRKEIFACKRDYALYRRLLAECCEENRVAVWGYCLMPNHVHLIMVPQTDDGIARAVGETHRRYATYVNARNGVTGHLFQGRFGSVAMDENHLFHALRYVAMNPVKAGLVARPEDWAWSSTRAYLRRRDDALVQVGPVLARIDDISEFLGAQPDHELENRIRIASRIGRPLMDDARLREAERALGIRIRRRRPGPKPGRSGHDRSGDLGIL